MRRSLVSFSVALSTQQSHSLRARGVMSSQVARALSLVRSTFRKSAGILLCIVPTERVFVVILLFYYKRYTKCMSEHRIYRMAFSTVYPLYVAKAQKKQRTKDEVDEIICWLTGYSRTELEREVMHAVTLEEFFTKAPNLNPLRKQITGVVCGVRVEEIEDPLMREVRYLDKLIDELARGKSMQKIMRTKEG